MVKRIYSILMALLILGGLLVVILLIRQPAPKFISEFAGFNTIEESAITLGQSLTPYLQSSSLTMVGYQVRSEAQKQLLQKILNSWKENGIKFDVIYADKALGEPLAEQVQTVDFQFEFQTKVQEISQLMSENKKVLILVPPTFSSPKVEHSLAYFLEKNLEAPLLTISIMDFPRTRSEEAVHEFPCVVEGVDQSGLGPLGCQIVQIARSFYSVRFNTGQVVGLATEVSPNDVILFYTIEK
jgi:hypothetical protein